jgi:gamma-glutamyl:cysteine ligase YbdK (ATP-grasp superfamily)
VFHNANGFESEIVVAESNAAKVSNKLMEMFEQLAGKPTKETYEQATAMVSMANSIVNVQMAQIKFYRLK